MNPEHLIAMANQIGAFYESMKNRDEALEQLANHIRMFWDPRMRRALLSMMPGEGVPSTNMSAILVEALQRHRSMLA